MKIIIDQETKDYLKAVKMLGELTKEIAYAEVKLDALKRKREVILSFITEYEIKHRAKNPKPIQVKEKTEERQAPRG